jgi:hypothetical protein
MPQVAANFRGGDCLGGGSKGAVQFPAGVIEELKLFRCWQDGSTGRFAGFGGQKKYAIFRVERSFPFGIAGISRDEGNFSSDPREYRMWAGMRRVDGWALFARRANGTVNDHGVLPPAWDPRLIVAPLTAPPVTE